MVNKITGLGQNINIEKASSDVKDKKRISVGEGDKITISPEASKLYQEKKVSSTHNILENLNVSKEPLFRKEKVEIAKQRLNTNFYNDKTDEIVNALVEDLFG